MGFSASESPSASQVCRTKNDGLSVRVAIKGRAIGSCEGVGQVAAFIERAGALKAA